jgi:hypothetical protein
VTPEHALTEHASWILIHQRPLPEMAQKRSTNRVEQCLSSKAKRKTSTRAEFPSPGRRWLPPVRDTTYERIRPAGDAIRSQR